MSTTPYATLTRMTGLQREMQVIANNIANTATTGFRAERTLFSEFITRAEDHSLSMAAARIGRTDFSQGALDRTGGMLDFAISGEGFFQVQTEGGVRLTRNGAFTVSPEGELVTMNGQPVLDDGGAAIAVAPGTRIDVAEDGTLSTDGRVVGRLGLVRPLDAMALVREANQLFAPNGEVEPEATPRILQGALEGSNVSPVTELARLIEVSRAYELGQSFLDAENERAKSAIEAMTR